jgi:hypothetical protein
MFAFILLAAYLIMRLCEDITATVRKQPPPRHEYRMAKLATREETGTAPRSSFWRYLAGLWDDAWDSAHHRRKLMEETREFKRENKAKRKARRAAAREARKNRAAGADDDAYGFDATAPEPDDWDNWNSPHPPPADETTTDAAAAPSPASGSPAPSGPSTATAPAPPTDDGRPQNDPAGSRRHGCRWTVLDPADPDASASCGAPIEKDQTYCDRHAHLASRCQWGITNPNSPVCLENTESPFAAFCADHARQVLDPAHDEDPEVKEEDTDTTTPSLPNNVLPFKRTATTTTRMELPMTTPTSGEITGLDSAIAYAGGLSAYCTHTHDQIGTVLPKGEEAVTSCEQALANLSAGGVQGQALTDVASVQEQMTGAIAELQAALANLEAAGNAAESLKAELTSHLGVKESYNATPGAGSKEFVTAE